MAWLRRDKKRDVQRLRTEREQILAELTVAREEAAWRLAGTDPFELASGREWERTAAALAVALERIEGALFRAEIDSFDGAVDS